MAKKHARRTIRSRTTTANTGGRKTKRTAPRVSRPRTSQATKRTKPTRNVTAKLRTAESRARTRSAKQGWETRRANEQIALRRALAEHRKRSKAAKKGAETRRRNAAARARVRIGKSRKRTQRTRVSPERPGTRTEFIGAADYLASRRSSSVSVQVSAFGPADASAADAEYAIETKIKTGSAPKGWTVKLIDWKDPDAWRKLRKPLSQATITAHKA